MNVVLWIAQALLAAVFALSGLMKLLMAKEKLVGKYEWMQNVSQATIRAIGVPEVLGALGLILPAAVGIAPILTPLAATGLAVFALLAVGLHLRRRESAGLVPSAVLLVLTVFVAWGRFGPYAW